MRTKIINLLKGHPKILDFFWNCIRSFLQFIGVFIPINKKRVVFASFGGRKYDDSPKALYEEMLERKEFADWDFIWIFVNPEQFVIPRGRKVKIDTLAFFYVLLSSRVWVSNSGMDRGIDLRKRGIIKVETWHGTPIKKIGGEENKNSMLISRKKRVDTEMIRCSQSEFDREIFSRVDGVAKDAFLMCDLPRNDVLVKGVSISEKNRIKHELGIGRDNRRILLYMPTYREYEKDEKGNIIFKAPIDFEIWQKKLEQHFILLFRAHYAVSKALNIQNNSFIIDVSGYHSINDLYLISDALVSDYSSAFFDFSILDRPMFCFPYDFNEYLENRGLYLDLEKELPCSISYCQEDLLHNIMFNFDNCIPRVKEFHHKYAPFAGNATKSVINEIIKRIGN